MGFKMKGNPIKTGTIIGTASHKSALKQISNLDTQLGTYTKSQKNRAFGEDVDAREGAKILRTSTYNYHRMKKRWDKRQGNVETTEKKKKTKKKKKGTETEVSNKVIYNSIHDANWDYKRVQNEDGSFTYFTKKKSEENFYPVKDDIGDAIEEKVSFDIEQKQETVTPPPVDNDNDDDVDTEEEVVEEEEPLIGGDFLEKSQEDQGLRFPELGKYHWKNSPSYTGE
jgi:hypothetical protein